MPIYQRPTKLLSAIVVATVLWSVAGVFIISFTFAQQAGVQAACCCVKGDSK